MKHPYESTSAWLLCQSVQDPDRLRGFLDVDSVAATLGLDSRCVTGCLIFLSRVGAVVWHEQVNRYRWHGIRKANNLANHLRKTSTKTVTGKGQGLALRHKLAKGVNEVGFQKLSKYGVFVATVQLVMASENGIYFRTATKRLFDILLSENASGRSSWTNLEANVSNVLHCMVGLGCIAKMVPRDGDHSKTRFTWVGFPAPLLLQDQARAQSVKMSPPPPPKESHVVERAGMGSGGSVPPKVVPFVQSPTEQGSPLLDPRLGREKRILPAAPSSTRHPSLRSTDVPPAASNISGGNSSSSGRRYYQSGGVGVRPKHPLSVARRRVAVPTSSRRTKRLRGTACKVPVKLEMEMATPVVRLDGGEDDAAAVEISFAPTERAFFSKASKMHAVEAKHKTAEMVAEANRQLEEQAINEVRARFSRKEYRVE